MNRIPQFARAGVHDTDKRFRCFFYFHDGKACAFWYGCGGDVIAGRGFELEAGTRWYWRDRETGLISARGTVAMMKHRGQEIPAIWLTDGGWESLWETFGVLLGASTKESCRVMMERALGVGKKRIGVVILTDLQLLPRQAWFYADDLMERARNPYSCADRQDMAERFEEASEMIEGDE